MYTTINMCLHYFLVAAGDFCTFVNIRTNREQVRCTICSRIVGSFQPSYSWVSIVRIRLIRLSPFRITSVCINQTEPIDGDTGPHLHHCILASIDRNINSAETPIELISVRHGHTLTPICPYSQQFERSSIEYPLDIKSINVSTQTEEVPILQNANCQTEQVEVKIVEPSPPVEMTTNTTIRALTNTENAANNAFWESLAAEPSTTNGDYSEESVCRAIDAMEKETTDALIKELAEYLVELPGSGEPTSFDDIPNDVC